MTVVAPPEQPRQEELEALIREARARQRRRRLLLAAGAERVPFRSEAARIRAGS